MKTFLTAIAFGAMAAVVFPQFAKADHGPDIVTGHANNVFNQGFDVDFRARGTNTGDDVSGSFRATDTNADPNQVFQGEVLCMRVVGGTEPALFSIGGVLTRKPAGSALRGFFASGSDSGKFSTAPDTLNFSLLLTPITECPAPAPGLPVVDGEITIHNTLP